MKESDFCSFFQIWIIINLFFRFSYIDYCDSRCSENRTIYHEKDEKWIFKNRSFVACKNITLIAIFFRILNRTWVWICGICITIYIVRTLSLPITPIITYFIFRVKPNILFSIIISLTYSFFVVIYE